MDSCLSSGQPGHALLCLLSCQALTQPSNAVKAQADQRRARPLGPTFQQWFQVQLLVRIPGCLLTRAVPGPTLAASDSVVLG